MNERLQPEDDPRSVEPRRERGPRYGERGFSLVEVLIAAGLTAAILISISGLFVFGSQNVQTGRRISAATTVTQSVLEEIRGFSSETIYGLCDGQPEDEAVTWNTDQPNPTYTEDNEVFADGYNATLDGWRDLVRDELPQGGIAYTVEGFSDRPTATGDGTATFGSARFLRIEVTVYWTESMGRSRRVTMNLIKF